MSEELKEEIQIEEGGEATSPVEETPPVQEQKEEVPPEGTTPEKTPGEKPKEEEKEQKSSGLQKRFNKLAEDKRLLREENAYLRGVADGKRTIPQGTSPEPKPVPKPKIDDFENEGDFIEALTDWKVEKSSVAIRAASKAETEQSRQQAGFAESKQHYNEKVEEASVKHEDFQETLEGLPPISQPAIDAIMMAENGPYIAYHLGKNHAEANKIARMSPIQATIAIGRIDGKLGQQSPKKTITKAPTPINPLKGGGEAVAKTPDSSGEIEVALRKANLIA